MHQSYRGEITMKMMKYPYVMLEKVHISYTQVFNNSRGSFHSLSEKSSLVFFCKYRIELSKVNTHSKKGAKKQFDSPQSLQQVHKDEFYPI